MTKIKGLKKQPFFEYGFWWWWNSSRNDWFVGCAPSNGILVGQLSTKEQGVGK